MKKLQELKNKIIEAVPEIKQQMDTRGDVFQERDITLEDVLFAINKTDITKCKQYKDENWTMPEFAGHIVLKLVDKWRLNKPLNEQTEEIINFLHNILCKK